MKKNKTKRIWKGKHKDLVFYILMIAFPVVQFCIFYIGVNVNSFLLAFQKIDLIDNSHIWTGENFANAFKLLTASDGLLPMLGRSLLAYVLLTGIGTPLGLLFSYYIYKKMPCSNGFRVLLFLPSIISAIVMVTIFQFFVERAIPAISQTLFNVQIKGLLENPDTRFATLMFYNIWVGFGTGVLLYANGMSGISQEIVDSAHLDGAYGIKEFWHITLPMVYPTLTTFLIAGVAGIFSNQINLYSFYGNNAPADMQTFGYYLYSLTQNAKSRSEYPISAALGLILTFVAVPMTLLAKKALEKLGPKEG